MVRAFTTLVLRRTQMLAAFLALVAPSRREGPKHVLLKIGERLGAYVRAKVIVMAIVGV
jgi:predicted PurR-regulated permease PerM